jgi:hypothetical protein
VPRTKTPWLEALTTWSWAQPFVAVATLDVLLWQVVAWNGLDTAILVASGNLLLLALLATLWQDAALAYGAVVFLLLALVEHFEQLDLPFAEGLAWIGGAGFGMYLLASAAEQIMVRMKNARLLAVWSPSLTNSAIALTTLAWVASLPVLTNQMTASAVGLAFAGALYLAHAYRRQSHPLSYLGMALLEVAWALLLLDRHITQPQVYAIPAGLYFVAVGFLERHHPSISPLRKGGQWGVPDAGRKTLATLVESFGLAVLLLTSFIQSLNGQEGFLYFLLLMFEALLVIWWGAARRVRVPFFIGLGASVLNVIAQVVVLVNVYDVNRFIAIFVVGLLLVTLAVFIERQRVQIIAKAQQWLEVLEAWE